VEARLSSLEASLAIEHRQFEAARALLERSGALAHREGVRPEAACALLQLGRVHYYEGDFLPSFVAYHRGLSLLDPRNPRQEGDRLAGLGGMGWALPTLAMHFAEMYIARAHEGGFPSLALRGRWLLGRVLISAGGPEHAVPRLDSVRERFLADGLTLDAALVSLDLAWACSQVPGGGHRQHQLAREALPVLERHELPAEVERAVELWAHATLEGRSNRAFLESLRHDIAHLLRGVAPRRAVG
jgi:tetratricopeptide (TPR) repeat protein